MFNVGGDSFLNGLRTVLRRFGRCQSACASRRAGCCLSARWGTPDHRWELVASVSPAESKRWGLECGTCEICDCDMIHLKPKQWHPVIQMICSQTFHQLKFSATCDPEYNQQIYTVLVHILLNTPDWLHIAAPTTNFSVWFLSSDIFPVSLIEELLWNTSGSWDPFQSILIKQCDDQDKTKDKLGDDAGVICKASAPLLLLNCEISDATQNGIIRVLIVS